MRFAIAAMWAFILCLTVSFIQAQPGNYQFSRLDINQGLSHNQVNSILKDARGFMWFGTMSGLTRYDGYEMRVFRNDPKDSTSISDNYIEKIFEGPGGLIWVFTRNGVNVFDPQTETFNRNASYYLSSYQVTDGNITEVYKDRMNMYWFLHANQGIYRYDPSKKTSIHYKFNAGDAASISSNEVSSMSQDSKGRVWLIHRSGIIDQLDAISGKVISKQNDVAKDYNGRGATFTIYADADDDLWVYAANDGKGVLMLNSKNGQLTHFNSEQPTTRLNTNIVRGVSQDSKGLIWIATDHGGVNLIDKKQLTVRYLVNSDDEKSISQNTINSIYKDRSGIIWIGTYKKGISYFHENIIRFPLVKNSLRNPNSLPYEDVNCFAEDAKGNIWIGSNGGGLFYYDRATDNFRRYVHNASDANSLSNDVIVNMHLDKQGKLWIGTYYGGLDCFDGSRFIHYKNDASNANSISDNRIYTILEDSKNNLWIGTLGGGLDLLDRNTGRFSHYQPGATNSVHSSYISSLVEDRYGNLWVGTAHGVDVLDKASGRFMQYANNNAVEGSISNNNISVILEDSRGWIWIGTREGLNLYDAAKNNFRTFTRANGLPDNTIQSIVEDQFHNIWVSTSNGISALSIKPVESTQPANSVVPLPAGLIIQSFRNYDELDGLQGKLFNVNAGIKTRRGEIIFGGGDGFNIIEPSKIGVNNTVPPVVLTDFQLFNRSVAVGEKIDGRTILAHSVTETDEITLPYSSNFFSIGFAALNYFHPEKNQYKYILEGLSSEWLLADASSRTATFTNLDPGEYVFRVKASNDDGQWNEAGRQLVIRILPPFWKTPLAFIIYSLVIIAALVLSRHLLLERERMKFRMEQERQEAHQLHALDMMKIRFFTNISHEFRTPLTLVISPIEKLIKTTKEPETHRHLELIYRNARRLLNLVNQLLDFRRLELEEVNISPARGEVIGFIKDICESFSDLSEKKNIHFSFNTSVNQLETWFDHDKLEKILFNLLSNAFKFTPEQGEVEVEVSANNENANDEIVPLVIKVRDTGIGIPREKQDKIFERFFQHELPGSIMNQGSGIGLAITREFVKLHQGTITVDSEPERGSTFTVTLPVRKLLTIQNPAFAESITALATGSKESEVGEATAGTDLNTGTDPSSVTGSTPAIEPLLVNDIAALPDASADDQVVYRPGSQPVGPNNRRSPGKIGAGTTPRILLVEDNEDFRFYLKDNLKQHYIIAEAANGKEAWKELIATLPDLVVTDIAMPEMDGMDLCRKIKQDARTKHIPVILLTARSAEEQQLEGLETGANDFISKPFNFELLQSRIRNLIQQKQSLQKAYEKQIPITATDIQVTNADEKTIQKALAVVEKNLSDPDFSVEDLSRELFMSRVGLYKKLVALTAKTPIEFIRTIRLERAAQLLEKSDLSISEIAYEVGFNNPKYFSKYFKMQFGMLPSQYQSEKRNGKPGA